MEVSSNNIEEQKLVDDLIVIITENFGKNQFMKLKEVKAFLEAHRGVDYLNKFEKGKSVATPLYAAAAQNFIDIMELLVEFGADIYIKNNCGTTALHTAVFARSASPFVDDNDFERIVKLLRNIVNVSDENGHLPIQYAMITNDIFVLRCLIENGADVNLPISKENTTILFEVVSDENENLEMAKLLLDSKADVNARRKDESTPLMFACSEKMAKLLLDYGADINAQDEQGLTALMHTRVDEIGCELIKAGANIHLKDIKGMSALQHSMRKKHLQCVQYLAKNLVENFDRIHYHKQFFDKFSFTS